MRRSSFVIASVAASLIPVGGAGADPSSLFDHELVRNGAAEADEGSTDPHAAKPVLDWHTLPGAAPVLALRYGAKGVFPRPDSPGASYHGRNFFWGGFSARAGAYQDIDLSSIAADIDERTVHFQLSAWLGGRESMGDHATVGVTFLDGTGKERGVAYVGPVTPQDRGGVTSFQYREVGRLVPAGTRTARITIVMVRYEGDTNDGYVDGISFFVHKSGTPAR